MRLILKNTIALFCFILVIASCSKRNYNIDAETMVPQAEEKRRISFFKSTNSAPVAVAADTAKPNIELTADTTLVQVKKKKKRKKNKREFLGYRVKRGYTKYGSGNNTTIETFYYLPKYIEPSKYAPAKYYFNTRRKRIYKASTIDPKVARILHGPYKKMIGKKVVAEGYFYVGTRHLRWENYNRDFILLNKNHYEKGFPRDAIINYYDADRTKIKEVIPYAEGKLNGDYVMFHESGLRAWEGQYEDGKKVGIWIEYWPFRNRKHYEYQYPETSDSEQFEPFLYREWDRQNNIIYERGKLDKRTSAKQP